MFTAEKRVLLVNILSGPTIAHSIIRALPKLFFRCFAIKFNDVATLIERYCLSSLSLGSTTETRSMEPP